MSESPAPYNGRTDEPGLKLYAFQPTGFGQLSFFVVAGNLVEATEAVDRHIATETAAGRMTPDNYEGWPGDYDIEVAAPGVVMVNDNG